MSVSYQLTLNPAPVLRMADGSVIPHDLGNADYQSYLSWLAAGNTATQPAASSNPSTISAAAYFARFTASEISAVTNYVISNPLIMTSANTINNWLVQCAMSQQVALTGSAAAAAHAAMVSAGCITQARSTAILTP